MKDTRVIKGTIYNESGQMMGRPTQRFAVLVSPMGDVFDPVTNDQLTVEREEIAKGVHVDVIHAGTRLWKFHADEGECARAGIVVSYGN